MLVWTSIFIKKVKTATADIPDWELHMMQYYVDDGNLISDPLPPGTRLIGDKFVVMEEHVEEDMEIPDDERTAKLMTKLGNGIFEFIRLTCD